MDKKLAEMIHNQMNNEIYLGMLYANLSARADEFGMHGFSKWLFAKSKEEFDHYMSFYNFLLDLNQSEIISVGEFKNFKDINLKPNKVQDIAKLSLKIEKDNYTFINKILTYANENKNFYVVEFLQFFVKESRSEIVEIHELIDNFILAKDNLYTLDYHLGKSVNSKKLN